MNDTVNKTPQKSFKIVPIVVGGAVVGLVIGGSLFFLNNENNKFTNNSSSISSNSSSLINHSEYKDGTYTATTSYSVPDGISRLQVDITISNGVISKVTVNTAGSDSESAQYTSLFSSGINSKVIGKKLDQAYVSGSINGASLTGNGFNKALDTIINRAKK